MQTFIVEVLNDKAVPLLKDLENLNLLRIKPSPSLDSGPVVTTTSKLSEQFWGTLSPETATKMHMYVESTRNEWERDI